MQCFTDDSCSSAEVTTLNEDFQVKLKFAADYSCQPVGEMKMLSEDSKPFAEAASQTSTEDSGCATPPPPQTDSPMLRGLNLHLDHKLRPIVTYYLCFPPGVAPPLEDVSKLIKYSEWPTHEDKSLPEFDMPYFLCTQSLVDRDLKTLAEQAESLSILKSFRNVCGYIGKNGIDDEKSLVYLNHFCAQYGITGDSPVWRWECRSMREVLKFERKGQLPCLRSWLTRLKPCCTIAKAILLRKLVRPRKALRVREQWFATVKARLEEWDGVLDKSLMEQLRQICKKHTNLVSRVWKRDPNEEYIRRLISLKRCTIKQFMRDYNECTALVVPKAGAKGTVESADAGEVSNAGLLGDRKRYILHPLSVTEKSVNWHCRTFKLHICALCKSVRSYRFFDQTANKWRRKFPGHPCIVEHMPIWPKTGPDCILREKSRGKWVSHRKYSRGASYMEMARLRHVERTCSQCSESCSERLSSSREQKSSVDNAMKTPIEDLDRLSKIFEKMYTDSQSSLLRPARLKLPVVGCSPANIFAKVSTKTQPESYKLQATFPDMTPGPAGKST